MKQPIHVATSPLTNTIYAGRPNKKGDGWTTDRSDVTGAACAAVAIYALAADENGVITVNCNGLPRWEISVIDLERASNTLSGATVGRAGR